MQKKLAIFSKEIIAKNFDVVYIKSKSVFFKKRFQKKS